MKINYKLPDFGIDIAVGSQKRIDYKRPQFTVGEFLLYLIGCEALLALVASLFYDSFYAFLFGNPLVVPMMHYLGKRKISSRKKDLRKQFKDMVLSVSAAQKAGYSVENAFRESTEDMELLYGKRSLIVKELRRISIGLDHNLALETMLSDLGERSDNDEIRQFGEIFLIAKRSGGNLTELMALCAEIMEQQEEVEQEIQVVISSKRLESRIMSIVPFLIILYMSSASSGFFDALYHNPAGIVIMTGCLMVYVIALFLSERIVDIQI